ncbi:MAG: hypothetical protein COY58_00700 [Gammaproteobacteria bacterium CG_4_10_14_0_8_um_filter_38_16]|nr:MAG: hypothetical protein COY58_00700 [Gammaproteobacteria bacterium CG_4_10_14_0_8_um_filter_38_16]PJA04318.1 MAG: hypothetical protein COX72_00630 [Gammaproteobacteria bacterium CG_4_10_14_0_2_um_filter_38_22]PJB10072.1 MAG: hypothetical protein CO120_06640 [Gammaproteobacteria bacterium CG_4_9_14_3_um_filter_38_9]
MGFRSYVKNTVKDNTNVKGWVDWSAVKENGRTIGSFIKSIKTPDLNVPVQKTTFEAAVKKYNLSDAQLQQQMRSHFRVACVCLLLGLGALGWAVKILLQGMITSSFVSVALSILMLAYAFREHFLYFQIKQRRLGCSVHDWFFTSFLSKNKGRNV